VDSKKVTGRIKNSWCISFPTIGTGWQNACQREIGSLEVTEQRDNGMEKKVGRMQQGRSTECGV
jgi:hypothetical protein